MSSVVGGKYGHLFEHSPESSRRNSSSSSGQESPKSVFVVRVVLHGADPEKYGELYEAMSEHGFRKVVGGDDGNTYKLPDGEYITYSDLSVEQILEKAQRAVANTDVEEKAGFMVSELRLMSRNCAREKRVRSV